MYRLVGLLAIFVTAGIAYALFSNTSGAKDSIAAAVSQEICTSIKPGMSMQQISELARNKNGWFRAYAPYGAYAGANGWYSKCRCNITFKDGVVVNVAQRVCIN